MDHTDFDDYPELDTAEDRRIELLTPEGEVFRRIWASINFCRDGLPLAPPEIYPQGSSWRVAVDSPSPDDSPAQPAPTE
jgi:hypothetical protein